ncbi:MAG: hypothetical protein LBB55_07615 [Zoogloeaceae bacterium]|jgi:hypothetical protein|nr:hypothetical protein [Zoogloeaceae bacterium]
MENPYEPPSSDSEEQSTPARASLFPLILGVAFAFVSALIPAVIVPYFASGFTAVGADLPMATLLLIEYHSLLWLLPILVVVVHFSWPQKEKLPLLLGIFSLLALPFMVWALYLPISHIGEAL